MGQVGAMRADFSHSVQNEWLCLTLLGAMGLSVAESQVMRFREADREVAALVVTRFDRRRDTTADRDWIVPLPQEDCCQATGTPAEKKYEVCSWPWPSEGNIRIDDWTRSTCPIGVRWHYVPECSEFSTP